MHRRLELDPQIKGYFDTILQYTEAFEDDEMFIFEEKIWSCSKKN